MKDTVDIWIAGAAGDGVQSTAEILGRMAARSGLHVFIYNSYQSAIRGGYAYAQVRISTKKAWLAGGHFDILLCLNADSLGRHKHWANSDGLLIFNNERSSLPSGSIGLGLPASEIVSNHLMQNVVFLGSVAAICGIPLDSLHHVILDIFKRKSQEVKDANLEASRKGWERAAEFKDCHHIPTQSKSRLMMTGNQAFAFGGAHGGVKFYAAYPMTPATGVLHWMADHGEKLGIVVEQCEDEISVINMATGASFAGARSMVATSGGGFALMTEAIGQAAMTETPLVAINVCRAGPSTGVPTKTEQGDLWQTLCASQGEYPKVVLAPLSCEDAFYMTQTALNLADRYQIPVLMVSDLLLSEHSETMDNLDTKRVPIDRGTWAKAGDGSTSLTTGGFKRYLDTDTGVSPRTKPGSDASLIFTAATDEHDERGHVISDVFTNPVIRQKMMEKRMRKMDYIAKEMPPNLVFGDKNAELTLVGWGSTYNLLRAIVDEAPKRGMKVNALAIRSVWPFLADEVTQVLKAAKKTLLIENNFTAQMGRLIRQETGIKIPYQCLKFDGEPFYLESTLEVVKKVYEGKAKERETILTPYGLTQEEVHGPSY